MNSRTGRAILAGLFVATVPGWRGLPGSRIAWTVLFATAVVQHLATLPGRDGPRIQELRRYLARDLLFPARHRHGDGRSTVR